MNIRTPRTISVIVLVRDRQESRITEELAKKRHACRSVIPASSFVFLRPDNAHTYVQYLYVVNTTDRAHKSIHASIRNIVE